MPIAIDPETRIPFVLESDQGKENPPTFFLRPLTVREFRKADAIDADIRAANAEPNGDPVTVLMNGVRLGLVGWENVKDIKGNVIPYAAESLEDVVDISEAGDLMRAVQNAGALAKEDKKKSESQLSCSTGNSVSSASAGSA